MLKDDGRAPEVLSRQIRTYAEKECFRPGPLVSAASQGRLLIVEELDRAGRDTLFSVFFDG